MLFQSDATAPTRTLLKGRRRVTLALPLLEATSEFLRRLRSAANGLAVSASAFHGSLLSSWIGLFPLGNAQEGPFA